MLHSCMLISAGSPQALLEILRDLPLGFSRARIKQFSYKVSSLRNDLAHYGGDRDKPPNVKYTRKLHNYCEAISPIYHALLLREIGVQSVTFYSPAKSTRSAPIFNTSAQRLLQRHPREDCRSSSQLETVCRSVAILSRDARAASHNALIGEFGRLDSISLGANLQCRLDQPRQPLYVVPERVKCTSGAYCVWVPDNK